MMTRFILIACLAIARQALGTQVYETPSETPQQQWQPWNKQELTQVSNRGQENSRPVTFDNAKEPQQSSSYNANIQSGVSKVANVLTKQSVESVIENILASNQQGRDLSGYDEVYSDPTIKNALRAGNDTIARTFIRDKLCSLNLMNCDDTEERRYSPHRDIYPHDVIYAQPVTIKPVGRPLPAVPVVRPYGPAKPVPLQPSFGISPTYPKPLPGISIIGGGPLIYRKPNLHSKPIYEYSGESFEDKFIDKKQVVLHQPGPSSVQHVHHHFHHADGNAAPGVVQSSAAAVPSYNTLGSNGLGQYGYGGGILNDYEDYKKTFKIKTNNPSTSKGYAERYPVYQKPNSKEFNPGGFDGNYQYNGGDYDSLYYENCVCVPYDQCAAINQIGRKEDDLILAINPRNLDKDIEAETDEGNGTLSVAEVPKGASEIEEAKNEQTEEAYEAEVTKRSRRDVTKKEEVQERLTIGTGDLDSSKLNVRPTWGVSFGLPQTGGVGPIAPHSGNPLGIPGYTPGYGLVGGQGINLGPVSVNPLLAVQVTKDEYGEKVVKPYVNLHVTPNPGLVHKLGSLLAYKKYGLYGGHHGGYDVYAPHYHTHHERPVYHYPSRPPFHQPYGDHFQEHYPISKPHYHGGYYPTYYKDYNDNNYDDYDYSDDYADDYYRNARTKNASKGKQSLTKDLPQKSSGEQQAKGKITFLDRSKRGTLVFNEITSERRRNGRPPICGPYHVCCAKSNIIGARPSSAQCGVRNAQSIHGRIKTPEYVDPESEFGEYPWQALILKKDSTSVYVCGGTLISSRHVLTATHSIKPYNSRELRVRLGEWDVAHDVEFYPYIERNIVNIFMHPDYYSGNLHNDIAILKLDQDVDFARNPHIATACLPNKYDDFVGKRCWVSGWGKDSFDLKSKHHNILKEVDMPIVDNYICEQQLRRKLGPDFTLHPGFMCAGGEKDKDACIGDGGGPLVCENHGNWQVAGIVSWGIGCGQANLPGVYSRVSYYLDWIQQTMHH